MEYYLVSVFDNHYRRHLAYVVVESPNKDHAEKVCRKLTDSTSTYSIFQVFDRVPRRVGQRDYHMIKYENTKDIE
jgi:hypothetical protein